MGGTNKQTEMAVKTEAVPPLVKLGGAPQLPVVPPALGAAGRKHHPWDRRTDSGCDRCESSCCLPQPASELRN